MKKAMTVRRLKEIKESMREFVKDVDDEEIIYALHEIMDELTRVTLYERLTCRNCGDQLYACNSNG